jgi:Ni/Co efflux regulator RcnB
MLKKTWVLLLVGLLAAPAVAAAQGRGKGKGKHKGKHDGDRVVFVDTDRDVVRSWWNDTYGRGNCPPGLAKKNNGCLPPGQAKKRYVVGRRLPRTVVVERVPSILLPRLRTAPAGYDYVVVDGDVLLMNRTSRLIADAIVNLFD